MEVVRRTMDAYNTRDLSAYLCRRRTSMKRAVDLGQHVLVVLQTTGRGSHSGVPVTQQIAEIWSFANNRVVSGRSFASRAEAFASVGLRE